jgi:hypothetical protein
MMVCRGFAFRVEYSSTRSSITHGSDGYVRGTSEAVIEHIDVVADNPADAIETALDVLANTGQPLAADAVHQVLNRGPIFFVLESEPAGSR